LKKALRNTAVQWGEKSSYGQGGGVRSSKRLWIFKIGQI